jgi:hypothetical protein
MELRRRHPKHRKVLTPSGWVVITCCILGMIVLLLQIGWLPNWDW